MLPKRWGKSNPGPQAFPLIDEGLRVEARYRLLGGSHASRQLAAVFETARRAGADRVFVDRPYIDSDYRSDLLHFYGRAFRPPPDTTERLLFASTDRMLGSSVIRPLPQMVGRTMMVPPAEETPYVSCLTTVPVHAFGHTWLIRGFPFTSQDGEYGVCAHAAMWSIARYHHLRFRTDHLTTSAIIEAAGLRERADRTARSEGVSGPEIVRAFRGIGLPALLYDIAKIPPPESLDSVARRYLDSGIPIGVLTRNHMKILVGYGERASGPLFYIVCDDNHSAYHRENPVAGSGVNAWTTLVIPQPGRTHVNGEAAQARGEEAFEDRVRANTGPSHLLSKWKAYSVKTYASPCAAYVNGLKRRGVPDQIAQHHIYAPKGIWLWIVEFHDEAEPADTRVVGEIAIDATSLQLDPSPVIGNIDGWAYIWEAGDEEPVVVQAAPAGARYRSAVPDRSERPAGPPPPAFKALDSRAAID